MAAMAGRRAACAKTRPGARQGPAQGRGRRRAPGPRDPRAQKGKNRNRAYSVLNEWPQEHDFVTFGLLILKPEPMRLSM